MIRSGTAAPDRALLGRQAENQGSGRALRGEGACQGFRLGGMVEYFCAMGVSQRGREKAGEKGQEGEKGL